MAARPDSGAFQPQRYPSNLPWNTQNTSSKHTTQLRKNTNIIHTTPPTTTTGSQRRWGDLPQQHQTGLPSSANQQQPNLSTQNSYPPYSTHLENTGRQTTSNKTPKSHPQLAISSALRTHSSATTQSQHQTHLTTKTQTNTTTSTTPQQNTAPPIPGTYSTHTNKTQFHPT